MEQLRLEYTEMTQDQFAVYCKIPIATYRRMVSGRSAIRLTPFQMINICRICKISANKLLAKLTNNPSDVLDD